MPKRISYYYERLRELTKNIRAVDCSGRDIDLESGFNKAIQLITDCDRRRNKIIFIGNGASAAISSHMAADFCKNGRIKAMAFNDPALLTCLSNDLGFGKVFEKPIEMLVDSGDILIAISSSGKSGNIINGVKAAHKRNCRVITLSGFSENNPLLKEGEINFYVPSDRYSDVEIIHHSVCHYMLDIIIEIR